jgi:hypothetical protein
MNQYIQMLSRVKKKSQFYIAQKRSRQLNNLKVRY